jgi:hypothetical protein
MNTAWGIADGAPQALARTGANGEKRPAIEVPAPRVPRSNRRTYKYVLCQAFDVNI